MPFTRRYRQSKESSRGQLASQPAMDMERLDSSVGLGAEGRPGIGAEEDDGDEEDDPISAALPSRGE